MAHLRNPATVPPGGFVYLEPRSKLRIKGENLARLVAEVVRHREHRGYVPSDTDSVRRDVETQLCSRLDGADCVPDGPSDPWRPVLTNQGIRLADIMAFSAAAIEWARTGSPLVDLAENQRRREICATCPLNIPIQGCRCAPLYRVVAAAIPKERRFDDLQMCGICHCSLPAKCAVPAAVIARSEKGRNIQYPIHCWCNEIPRE